ncbi:tetratricopeptide repeat protein [Lacinutrix chionoecetis]
MRNIITYILLFAVAIAFSQQEENEKTLQKLNQKSNNLISEANDLASNDDFVSAEMEYRKAISVKPNSVAGTYNLGHQYYQKGNYEEALFRNQQAIKYAEEKKEKHRAFHNIGNILMQEKKCSEAVEAFKNALRNDPTDEETRYNFALAKECAKNQEPPQEEDNKDDKEKDKKENEDQKDNQQEDQGDNKEDNKDQGDDDKKEGEDNEDEGKPDEEKEKDGKGDDEKKEQPKPQNQPGQLSPQQIKNLLEAMDNQEQKVQEKMNAEKAKGAKIQTEKDW